MKSWAWADAGGLDDLLGRCASVAAGDVLADRAVEEENILIDQRQHSAVRADVDGGRPRRPAERFPGRVRKSGR
jgi:hypothetical protein